MYSMTKPITSAAALILYEQGKFLLNDPLHVYLPEFEHMTYQKQRADGSYEILQSSRPVRIRDLFAI